MVPDDRWLWTFAAGTFVAGVTFGYSIMAAVVENFPAGPKDFTCTESAIVNGVAECVKYERREK